MKRLRPALALALALAGCTNLAVSPTAKPTRRPATATSATPGATPRPAGTATPRVALQGTLVGRARLIAGVDGKLGTGATLISDAGGGVISDHGGGIISNNSGGVISDHGGAYRVQQAAGLAAYALAEAVVALTDAKGEALKDAAGRAIETKTDGQGEFAFTQAIPQGASVARIKLFNGGELRALVVNDGTELAVDLDTASTLGATYVLDQFVIAQPDPGAVLAKLPRTEAERLHTELGAIEGFLGSAPGYQAADMVAATDKLRAKVKAVDTVIEDVRALLLGQKNLGEGLPGDQVPLSGPVGLEVAPDGTLLIGEQWPGRVRAVSPDGTIRTLMDVRAGAVKSNVMRMADLARGPDGTLYVFSATMGKFAAPPGAAAVVPLPAGFADARPERAAVGPDGTLYVGEYSSKQAPLPRLLTCTPAGVVGSLVVDPAWQAGGRVAGLGVAADGALTVLYVGPKPAYAASLYRVVGGVATKLPAPQTGGQKLGDLAVAKDGTAYLSLRGTRQVARYDAATGALTPIAGPGTGAEAIGDPESLAVGPDGTVYVADIDGARVYALPPGGGLRTVAGTDGVLEEGATTRFAINQPLGLAFDADGSLLIAEAGGGRVRRFRGGRLEPFAGNGQGSGGDGGPATAAQLDYPVGLARTGDGAWLIAEAGGVGLRRVGADGIMATVLGGGKSMLKPAPGTSAPAAGRAVPQLWGAALDAAGNVFITSAQTNQLFRLGTDGMLAGMAGPAAGSDGSQGQVSFYLERDEASPQSKLGFPAGVAVGPDGALYFAEMFGCRIVRIADPLAASPVLARYAGRSFPEMMALAGDGATPEAVSPEGAAARATTLALPTAIAFDAAGALYVAEAGTLHFSGAGGYGLAEDGPSADIFALMGLPRVAGRVRKIAKDGAVTTVLGHGSKWFADDDGDDALLLPMALAIAPDGRLAVADAGANMVRILPAGSY